MASSGANDRTSLAMTNDLPGISAGVLTAASRVPQIGKTWKTRSAGELPLTMYAMLCTGFLLWLTYGIMTKDIPIIQSNVVSPSSDAALRAAPFYLPL